MRLLSYNIHKGIGGRDRRYRIDRIIEVIELQNPDLVCLQEVDRYVKRSHYDDQPKLLGDYFQAAARIYQMNVRLKTGGYGNLILSRWPVVSQHQISLRLNRKKPRGAQLVVVDSPEGRLQLVNCHLGLAERERQWQTQHLLTHRLFRDAVELPTIIAGDSNDWRNTLTRGQFADHDFQQITHPVSRFRSFPAYLPIGPLDKAFYRGNLTILHARVIKSQLTKSASDHLPLVIDFHLGAVLTAGPPAE
jgi:endonuclease/exonuclease/phosphatase family metal-dependent hydrolase